MHLLCLQVKINFYFSSILYLKGNQTGINISFCTDKETEVQRGYFCQGHMHGESSVWE